MRRLMWLSCVSLAACGNSITDPCPGQRTCPGGSCCDDKYPYNCGTQCYTAPCGPTEVTCIHVDRTDGCYGGTWQGTITGTGAPGGSLTFDILQHAITVSVPGSGTGTIDCSTGIGTFTLSGTSMITFHGTWRHTDSQGDRISDATWNGTSSTVTGTWDALRIE